jgi:hypothetical protein
MIENSPTPISVSVEQLFKEIRDIYGQYKREVPRKRGPWPQAIQSRVLELWKLGVSTHTIAAATGLACQTMYSWRQRLKKQLPDGFLPIPVTRRRRRKSHSESYDGEIRDLVSRSYSNGHRPTVSVVIGDEIRLEGVPVAEVARIIREVRRG